MARVRGTAQPTAPPRRAPTARPVSPHRWNSANRSASCASGSPSIQTPTWSQRVAQAARCSRRSRSKSPVLRLSSACARSGVGRPDRARRRRRRPAPACGRDRRGRPSAAPARRYRRRPAPAPGGSGPATRWRSATSMPGNRVRPRAGRESASMRSASTPWWTMLASRRDLSGAPVRVGLDPVHHAAAQVQRAAIARRQRREVDVRPVGPDQQVLVVSRPVVHARGEQHRQRARPALGGGVAGGDLPPGQCQLRLDRAPPGPAALVEDDRPGRVLVDAGDAVPLVAAELEIEQAVQGTLPVHGNDDRTAEVHGVERRGPTRRPHDEDQAAADPGAPEVGQQPPQRLRPGLSGGEHQPARPRRRAPGPGSRRLGDSGSHGDVHAVTGQPAHAAPQVVETVDEADDVAEEDDGRSDAAGRPARRPGGRRVSHAHEQTPSASTVPRLPSSTAGPFASDLAPPGPLASWVTLDPARTPRAEGRLLR